MAADPVTSPVKVRGMISYGIGIGVIIMVIRLYIPGITEGTHKIVSSDYEPAFTGFGQDFHRRKFKRKINSNKKYSLCIKPDAVFCNTVAIRN